MFEPPDFLTNIIMGWAFIMISVPIVAYRSVVKWMPDIVRSLGLKRLLIAYLLCLVAIGMIAISLGVYKFTYDPPVGGSAETTTFPIFTAVYFGLLSCCIVPLIGMLYLPLNLFLIKWGWNTMAILAAVPAAIATAISAAVGMHDPAVFLPAWLLVFLPLTLILMSFSMPLGISWRMGKRKTEAA